MFDATGLGRPLTDAPKREKSELRQYLDRLSDSHVDILAASFWDKEAKINKFISNLEIFLDILVKKIDALEAKNG